MKCMVAAVILALAVVSEAGVVPAWPYGVAHWGAPTVIQSNVLAHPYGALSHAAVHAAYPAVHAAAWPVAPVAPAFIAAPHAPAGSVAHHAGVVPGAVSVTANRGSVHVAPLAGHAVSQQQLNLAPAPGTI